MPTRRVRIVAPIIAVMTAAPLLAGASVAAPRTPTPDSERGRSERGHSVALPRHDLVRADARRKWKYKYAGTGQTFRKGRRAKGLFATFTVHKPKEVRWRRGDHSLAEMALERPGSGLSYIEVGWVRGNNRRSVRLFVFWWDRKGNPRCYNMRCRGFVRKGKGKRPGAKLEPGSKIRLGWRHKHNRWNLYVNGKLSGYYPDRLWNNKFNRASSAQLFGEVAYSRGGRCIDMGNGRFPGRRRGARISRIRVPGPPKAHFRTWNETRGQYRVKWTHKRAFRYGGPGPC